MLNVTIKQVRSNAKEGNVGCRGKIFADKIRAVLGDLLGGGMPLCSTMN